MAARKKLFVDFEYNYFVQGRAKKDKEEQTSFNFYNNSRLPNVNRYGYFHVLQNKKHVLTYRRVNLVYIF